MRFNHFRQIVARIRTDVPCPRCGANFEEHNIEVIAANVRNIEFYAPCVQCGAEVGISAQIEPMKRVHQAISPLSGKKGKISPEIVRDISSVMQGFQGRDVRELFQ